MGLKGNVVSFDRSFLYGADCDIKQIGSGYFFEDNLSEAEVKCFKCIVQGMTSKKVARKLGISSRTVEAHTDKIKYKLGLQYKHEIIECFYAHNPYIRLMLFV